MRLRRTLFLLFAIFVVYGTTIPFRFVGELSAVEYKLDNVLAHPLAPHDSEQGFSTPDIVQNLALFVPFGVLGVLAGAPHTRWGWRRILVVTALAVGLALGVEAFQLLTRDRTSSFIDVGTDTVGSFIGAVAANVLRGRTQRVVNWAATAGWLDALKLYPIIVALVVATIAAWMPFDATLDVGMIVPKVRMLLEDRWQYTGLNDEGIALIQYALLAVAVSAWLAAVGQRHPAIKAAMLVAIIAFALESVQITIMSRMPSLEDAAVHAGGGVLGAWLWVIGGRRSLSPLWLVAIFAGTLAAVVIQVLGPPESLMTRRLYQRLYLRTYERSAVPTLTHSIEGLLAYVPIGYVASQIFAGRLREFRAALSALTMAAAIAVPVAFLHGWELGTSEVVWDIGAALAGAAIGAWAAIRGPKAFERAVRSWQDSRAMDNV